MPRVNCASLCEIESGCGNEADELVIDSCRLALYRRIARRGIAGWSAGRCSSIRVSRLVLHALFECAEPFTDALAQLRQLPWPKDEQGNEEDDEQVGWL